MHYSPQLLVALFIATLCQSGAAAYGQVPSVVGTSPAQNSRSVPPGTEILVSFNTDMDASTINDATFVVFGSITGLYQGTISYDSIAMTATFDPQSNFAQGEQISVGLSNSIQSSEGIPLTTSYLFSFTAVAEGSRSFIPGTAYSVGEGTYYVLAGDFNKDGLPDLAVVAYWSASVSILLNVGQANFVEHAVYGVGAVARSLVSVDLNVDGNLDLAVAYGDDSTSSNVTILFGNGDGSFSQGGTYPVGNGPHSICAADLDGDNDLDLATANHYSDDVSVLLNDSDGAFASHLTYSVGLQPLAIAIGDLDSDGDLDLATANFQSNTISVLLNDGTGSFGAGLDYAAGSQLRSISQAVDLDGDGDLDFAVTNSSANQVTLLFNGGDASFSSSTSYPTGEFPVSVRADDLDGDGSFDIVTANQNSGDISVLWNNGDGTVSSQFDFLVVGADSSSVTSPISVTAADFDGDGDLDLATTSFSTNEVSILLNHPLCGDSNGDITLDVADLTYLVDYLFIGGLPPVEPEAADVDGSGELNVGDLTYLVEYLFGGGPALACDY